jgi:lysyl-tRNA synthetase class 2
VVPAPLKETACQLSTIFGRTPAEVVTLARASDKPKHGTLVYLLVRRNGLNGFSELNDAEDQAGVFAIKMSFKEAGDAAMYYDADFIQG